MDLKTFDVAFITEEEYVRYLERIRWPHGIHCIYCTYARVSSTLVRSVARVSDGHGTVLESVPTRRIFQCGNNDCRKQFSATAGTIFHKTHVPLSKWFRAIIEVGTAPVTTRALQERLQVSYQTAWYLRNRIREALRSGGDFVPGIVEDNDG